jgi:putative spermidine/putrescine transport system permease protein
VASLVDNDREVADDVTDRRPRGRPAKRRPRYFLGAFSILVCLFSLLPMIVIVGVSFNATSDMAFPPDGWSLRWYEAVLDEPSWWRAGLLSFVVAVGATVVAAILGVGAAYGLTRYDFKVRTLVLGLLMTPLLFPSAMFGLALLMVLARYRIGDSLAALIVVHSVLVLPFFLRIVSPVFLASDLRRLEEASRSLGAGRTTTFARVTLPVVSPGLAAGATFAFIMSFIEFDVTTFMISGTVKTLPMKIYTDISVSFAPDIAAVSSILLLLSIAGVLFVDKIAGLDRTFRM